MSYLIIYRDYLRQKNKIKKKIELVEIAGIILMTILTFVLIIIFPMMGVMFPSILCEFAIFVAIAAFIGAALESRLHKKSR